MAIDEELQARTEEEDRRREFDAQQQQERLESQQAEQEESQEAQQSPPDEAADQAKNQAKEYAKKVAKKAIWEFLAATWEVWVPALAIIIGIAILVGFAVLAPVVICNSNYSDGYGTVGIAKLALTAQGICKQLAINNPGGTSGGAGGGAVIPGILSVIPQQYVKMSAFGPAKFDYPKLNSSFLSMVTQIMSQAQTQGLNVLVTSALRQPGGPEGYSCHYLGEAVDIDFSPAIPIGANQTPQNAALIDQLLSIARASGAGFVQDEYRHPSAGATAGHVHVALTSDPNCNGRQGEVAQYANEYTMPY